MKTKKVWFVTGASKGLGLILVKKLLKEGYCVAASSRTVQSLIYEIGPLSEVFLPLEMNLTNSEDVKKGIHNCVEHFGQIDVVVNNAGYALIGTLEELSQVEVQKNFEVNVFGYLNVIRHTTPFMRKQKSGHIFNISSVGGYIGSFPGFGIYCSTKFAVAGFSEALAEEMKPFNVHTTLVYPGYFRTNFLSKESVQTAENPISEYKTAREMELAHLNDIDGNQPNDPEKGADVLIALSKEEKPPVHFFMGKDAYHYAKQKIDAVQKTMTAYEVLASSTDITN
ncbi:MAG TPA: SDR family oxidoreductase [Flavobacterium sp.]|uniref:SDR family oxidoreductase n=1 Tax=unclassified Flavobacterium TaxID=196869 RepID=UPI000E86D3EA|nr:MULTISPECIES: SDR family oxidoreductase [unclassified Flavobacterium]HBI00655.1 short-chain dehydrogenase/reductase [Flavobacterium sp.]HRE76772.1 SDR family oxidoreductase [Flavobacterium sp.]